MGARVSALAAREALRREASEEPVAALKKWRSMQGENARYNEALCLVELGQKDAARSLLEAQQHHAFSVYALGLLSPDEEAAKLFLTAAKMGCPPALRNAANFLAEGRGCERDDKKALRLYEAAYELSGDPEAAFVLGSWHCSGRAPLDWDKGFEYHSYAAKTGMPKAVFNLGTHYFTGKGVSQDFAKAFQCFEQAAPSIPEANLNLANQLDEGLGVRRDPSKAAFFRSEFERKRNPNDEIL